MIQDSLKSFHSFIRIRQSKSDYGVEVRKFATLLESGIGEWIRRGSGYGTHEILRDNGQPLETAYLMTCEKKTHPVPKHVLRTRISDESQHVSSLSPG
jgi:hypothetical protein